MTTPIKTIAGLGYDSEGPYKPTAKGRMTKPYSQFLNMLNRCNRSESTICAEWEDFQVFAEWYVKELSHYEGYLGKLDLDKDILVKGNTEYNPINCCVLPSEINKTFKNTKSKGIVKNGRGYHAQYTCESGKRVWTKTLPTVEEVMQEVKPLREAHMLRKVAYYNEITPNGLPKSLYEHLLKYTV